MMPDIAANIQQIKEKAINASPEGFLIIENTPKFPILFTNLAFLKLLRYAEQDIVGQNCFFWCGGVTSEDPDFKKIQLAMKNQNNEQVIISVNRKDGIPVWVEINTSPIRDSEGKVSHFLWLIRDATLQKLQEEKTRQQVLYDSVTTLPNRTLLMDRLHQCILNAKRSNSMIVLWYIDLDKFKLINEKYSTEVGDRILKEVGNRLVGILRETDAVGHVGSDEFVLVTILKANIMDVIVLAKKILKKLTDPVVSGGETINITASIGVSIYPKDARDAESLIKNADIAMNRALEAGGNSFQFFSTEMNDEVAKQLRLEKELHQALINHDFILNFQPVIDLGTEKPLGAEALIRWQHPQKGIISPLEFISVAEESNLIVGMGEWVIEAACTQIKAWQMELNKPLSIAINISGRQFNKPDFFETIENILTETKLTPANVELEFTESILINNINKIPVLNKLKGLGVKIIMDDFGTGYSSLGYLKKFPVDKIKIDKSFVSGIDINPQDAKVVQGIITMAHVLGLKVLAEGVQSQSEMNFLKKYDCDEAQGYYFSPPLDNTHFLAFLKKL